jgi:hypothetical protein
MNPLNKNISSVILVFFIALAIISYKNSITVYFINKYRETKESIKCKSCNTINKTNLNYNWIKQTCEASFSPRDGAGIVIYKDSIRLIGGWNPRDKKKFPLTCSNDVWSSANGDIWINSKPNTFKPNNENINDWSGRHSGFIGVFKNEIFNIGGDAIQGKYQSDIWKSIDAINWENISINTPWSPRALFNSFIFDNKLWVLGGQTLPQYAKAEEKFYNDIWSSENGIDWKLESKNADFPQRGMIIGQAELKGKIYIIGGGTYETPKNPERKFYNDVWVSNDGINWKCLSKNNKWAPRQYHSIIVWDNKIWIIGGYSKEGNLNDVWFSEDGISWKELKNTPWSKRHATHVTVFNDQLWVISGSSLTSDVWKLEKIKN